MQTPDRPAQIPHVQAAWGCARARARASDQSTLLDRNTDFSRGLLFAADELTCLCDMLPLHRL